MDSINYEYWRQALNVDKQDQVLSNSDDKVKGVVYDIFCFDLFF